MEEQPTLYSKGIKSSRGGVFYNCFSYPTKISPESISLFIATHSNPGDNILDIFGGSGATGIACKLCSNPTDNMKMMATSMGLTPKWGPRNCTLIDVGTYASFSSNIICNPPNCNEFKNALRDFLNYAKSTINKYYEIIDNKGQKGLVRHIIWSDVITCPKCKKELSFAEGAVSYNPLSIRNTILCPFCGYEGSKDQFKPVTETVFDSILNKDIVRKKRVPFRIYGQTGASKWVRFATDEDKKLMCLNEIADYVQSTPKEIRWGDLHRSGYHLGITHLHHFYTRRNFNVMETLWKKTQEYSNEVGDALRLLLLSYNQSHSTLMTRVVVKKNSKDFVLTSAQSGVLYISSLPVEKNIVTGLERKSKYFIEAFEIINSCSGEVHVFNQSCKHTQLPPRSIDYVFTDPPFGDFIPYAEVNQINELWLDVQTKRDEEIIISATQGKSIDVYKNMMTDAFTELSRILKNDGIVTVVFHASKAAIWNTLESVFDEAGFSVLMTSILNKTQQSFKQVVSEGSVRGDPIILLCKKEWKTMIESHATCDTSNQITFADYRLEYSKYIEQCLKNNKKVKYDARDYYTLMGQETNGKRHRKKKITWTIFYIAYSMRLSCQY